MLATTALAAYAVQATAQNQMRTWTLPPNRANFAPTAGSAILPLATNEQYRVANGAYDASGNLLFYVKNLNVYKADGNMIGAMQYSTIPVGTSNTYNIPQKEIAIVPISGSCKKYLVIWLGARFTGSDFALRSVEVNLEGANPILTEKVATNTANDIIPGYLHAGLAVSKAESNGNRRLYVVTNLGYRMYNITSTGLSATAVAQTTWPATYPSSIYPSDVELSHDGLKIAWGSVENGRVFAASIEPSTKAISTTPKPSIRKNSDLISATFGVEFMPNGDLYYSVRSGNTKVGDGLYKVMAASVPALPDGVLVDTTKNNTNSHIELGYDGFLYMVNTSGKLVKFNTANNTSALSTSFTQTIVSNGYVQYDIQYSLPDQIDGENYTNFRGKASLAAPIVSFICPSIGALRDYGTGYEGNNCNIVLTGNASGVYDAYKLSIFTSDANRTQGTQVYTSGLVNGTIADVNITALANNYMQTNLGYYLIKLEVSNSACDAPITNTYFMNSAKWFDYTDLGVANSAAVTASNGVFNVFNCKPITLSPVRSNAFYYKLTLQSATATGQVLTGGTSLSYTSNFVSGFYSRSADLRTWPGTNNYIQNMTNGYILVSLELKDDCNTPIEKKVLLNIGSLAVGTSDFLFNYGNGTKIDPDITTLASPAALGLYSVGVDATSSTGSIDSYTMKIEKMNQASGVVLATVCNNPSPTLVPGNLSSVTGQGLNGYAFEKCGQSGGYFTTPVNAGEAFKLTFTVTNACGSSSKVGYFRNLYPNGRMGDTEETSSTQETLASQGHAMYPNPSTGKATLQYVLENETNVSLSITDAKGNKMATVLDNVSKSIGTYTQAIDLTNMPDGIYYYRLNTDKAIVGKIVKTSK